MAGGIAALDLASVYIAGTGSIIGAIIHIGCIIPGAPVAFLGPQVGLTFAFGTCAYTSTETVDGIKRGLISSNHQHLCTNMHPTSGRIQIAFSSQFYESDLGYDPTAPPVYLIAIVLVVPLAGPGQRAPSTHAVQLSPSKLKVPGSQNRHCELVRASTEVPAGHAPMSKRSDSRVTAACSAAAARLTELSVLGGWHSTGSTYPLELTCPKHTTKRSGNCEAASLCSVWL